MLSIDQVVAPSPFMHWPSFLMTHYIVMTRKPSEICLTLGGRVCPAGFTSKVRTVHVKFQVCCEEGRWGVPQILWKTLILNLRLREPQPQPPPCRLQISVENFDFGFGQDNVWDHLEPQLVPCSQFTYQHHCNSNFISL